MEICPIPTLSRPLHYVATFSRQKPLGLVLSEADEEDEPFWKEATKNAELGEVFVKEIVPDGQADKLGIFEIGDQLQGEFSMDAATHFSIYLLFAINVSLISHLSTFTRYR